MSKNLFINASTELLILHYLNQRDCYIYELTQAIHNNSGGNLEFTQNVIYIAAYKLEEKGMISEYSVLSGKKMKRVYYHLEGLGRRHYHDLMESYLKMSEGFRLVFSSEIGGAGSEQFQRIFETTTGIDAPTAASGQQKDNTSDGLRLQPEN